MARHTPETRGGTCQEASDGCVVAIVRLPEVGRGVFGETVHGGGGTCD